jgi:hypothetical protein
MAKNAIVGAHIFYRWNGNWGQPTAFTSRYTGREANAAELRIAALSVPHETPLTQEGQVAQAIRDIPGAEQLALAPSMRGNKFVAVRFNVVAREASEHVSTEDYTKKFETSENLKYALSSDTTSDNQKPLGASSAAPAPAAPTAATTSVESAGAAAIGSAQH